MPATLTKALAEAVIESTAVADDGSGTFEAVISTTAIDRDGEIIDFGAFEPLPKSIPIFCDHEQWDVKAIVATAVPYYAADGTLRCKGVFGSDEFSQQIRRKVTEGLIRSMSVGMLRPERKTVAGVVHIVGGELIEASFVGVPANPEAVVTDVKAATAVAAAPAETVAETVQIVAEETQDAPQLDALGIDAEALALELELMELEDDDDVEDWFDYDDQASEIATTLAELTSDDV